MNTTHHIATVQLGERGTADVWIRETGMIDVDMPTSRGTTYTIGGDPITTGNAAAALEAGDSTGFGDLTPAAMIALALALRAGIKAEAKHTAAGETTTTTARTPCPNWCEDRHQAGHWDSPGRVWQAVHARRFGPATVYLPEERHEDGEKWHGRTEVSLNHGDSLVLEGESVYTVADASQIAEHLSEAVQWAAQMDQQIAAASLQGRCTVDAEHPGLDEQIVNDARARRDAVYADPDADPGQIIAAEDDLIAAEQEMAR